MAVANVPTPPKFTNPGAALGPGPIDANQWSDLYRWFLKVQVAMTDFVSTTAARRPANTVSVGASYYDTTLSIPLWSDGTDWRDAAGIAH